MFKVKFINYLQALIIFLTSMAFFIAFTINFTPLYYWFVVHEKLANIAKMSVTQLMQNYHELLAYLNFPWCKQLVLDFKMSTSAKSHFNDVKQLFLLDYGVLIVGIVLSVWIIYYLKKTKTLWCLMRPLKMLTLIMLTLCGGMLINFEQFFIYFHQVLFNNDTWLFDPSTDPIINVLPSSFFMGCFILFFTGFLLSIISFLWWIKRNEPI